MEKYGNNPEQKFSGVELQIFPVYYHTWFSPVLVLESPSWGVLTGLPNKGSKYNWPYSLSILENPDIFGGTFQQNKSLKF